LSKFDKRARGGRVSNTVHGSVGLKAGRAPERAEVWPVAAVPEIALELPLNAM